MKTAKQHITEDKNSERHLMRTYYGFMLFLGIMLIIALSSCSAPRKVCNTYSSYSHHKK